MKKVLIIEDDEWLAEQFARVLEKDGIKARVSLNALSAIDEIDKFKPDVIILDLILTGSTGFVFLHELQSYTDTSKIPIILCTNLASEIDMENLKPYGVKRLIDKATMKPGDLSAAILSVL